MIQERAVQRPSVLTGPLAWGFVSLVLHVAVVLRSCAAPQDLDPGRPFNLPANVDFGVAPSAPGGGDATREPAPKPAVHKAKPVRARVKAVRDPNAFAVPAQAAQSAAKASTDPQAAAASSKGDDPDALGAGLGDGMGEGSGYAPPGATIALNVDLGRVRQTALVLETQSLLNIIPEWQPMLEGSGIDPLKDLERVFVASPSLSRASVVVAAQHKLGRGRIAGAVAQLAGEQGKPAAFSADQGFEVAPWRNRGPTERVIALTGADQFTITRQSDLARVLQVAQSLAEARRDQGFRAAELAAHGGLLAMQEKEAVALWVEGVAKYVRGEAEGVPNALRLSIYHVDQFNTELRVRAQYGSPTAAAAAMSVMDALRAQLADDPKVTFLGLKSAIERAELQQRGAALVLSVRLTLHQTRYLMRFVTRALKPRD